MVKVQYVKRYTRDFAQRNPDKLFVFGDNLAQQGTGGQARELRGEPNALGIPTKRLPSYSSEAFLKDTDFVNVKPFIDRAIQKIADFKGIVIFPSDGVGTGLAKLPETAPKIYRYICEELQKIGIINNNRF